MKQTHTIGYIETPAVKNLAKTKNALVEKGLIESTTPNEKIPNDLDKNLQELKPENIKLDVKIGNTVGTYEGEGIKFDIPAPTNIKVEDGILTFDPVDVSEYAEFNPVVSYLIAVNGLSIIEITRTAYAVSPYLNDGENVIEVTAKVGFAFEKNSINGEHTLQYSKPARYVVTLNATIDSSFPSCAFFKNKIYVLTGALVKIFDPVLKLFEDKTYEVNNSGHLFTLNSNLYIISSGGISKYIENNDSFSGLSSFVFPPDRLMVSVVGSDAYAFGGIIGGTPNDVVDTNGRSLRPDIYKFNGSTETLTKLDIVLPKSMIFSSAVTVGTDIYIFGGGTSSQRQSLTTVYKFNTIAQTIEQIDTVMPTINGFTGIAGAASVLLDTNNIYLIGGRSYSSDSVYNYLNILRFNIPTSTFEVINLTLPQKCVGGTAILYNDIVYLFSGVSDEYCYEIKL